jgi:hypothetical protein
MPLAAGFVGIIPALGLLDEKKDGSRAITMNWTSAVGWSCAVAYFGQVDSSSLQRTEFDHHLASLCHPQSEREW